ncbi:MAG: SCO family protein [Nitrospiraceae bacterium]|nr:SCO family protein [Nitrospiraceae bacterium]
MASTKEMEEAVPPGRANGGSRQRSLALRFYALLAVTFLVVAGASYFILTKAFPRNQASAANGAAVLRPSGIPSVISTPVANVMGLTPLPAKQAPGFSLVDQNGRNFSLSSFRGKTVVLEFMDPHCTDICPIVSQEFVDAFHDLGANASKVVFLAVNVNQYHNSVASVQKFSVAHGLDAITSWHFLTGPFPSLKPIWANYGIQVSAPNPNADIIHTSLLYFIDPNGNERFVAAPVVDHTKVGKAYLPADTVAAWGHGIANLASYLA